MVAMKLNDNGIYFVRSRQYPDIYCYCQTKPTNVTGISSAKDKLPTFITLPSENEPKISGIYLFRSRQSPAI